MPDPLDSSVRWRIKSGTLPLQEQGHSQTVQRILSSGLATGVVGLVSAGKEADVYLATYKGDPLAVKVYRLYRTSRRGGRPNKLDNLSWQAAREYDALHQAWKGGASVPAPARRVENMFSMRYLGREDGPAPRLQEVRLRRPKAFLEGTLAATTDLFQSGVVHGDLSAFNILVLKGAPWFIDFSDWVRVDRLGSSPWKRATLASRLLTRGLQALQQYFRRYDLRVDVDRRVAALMSTLTFRLPSLRGG